MSGEKLSLFTSIPVNKRPKTDNEQVFKEMVTLITNKQISTGKLVDFAQMLQDMAAAGIVISGNQVAIKGDKVTIYNQNEVALFAQDGKLNANLINADTITVNHLYAKSAQGGSVVGHFGNYDKSDAVAGDTQCPLWLGAATAANAPFRVTKEGAMYAVKGKIGVFMISPDGYKDSLMSGTWEDDNNPDVSRFTTRMQLSKNLFEMIYKSNPNLGDVVANEKFCRVSLSMGTTTDSLLNPVYIKAYSSRLQTAAIVIDSEGGLSPSYAIYARSGTFAGLRLNYHIGSDSYTINNHDHFILNTATNDNTVYTLPSPADSVGQVIFIANKYNYTCVVKGSIYNRGYASAVTVERYGMAIFISDGYHWIFKWFRW